MGLAALGLAGTYVLQWLGRIAVTPERMCMSCVCVCVCVCACHQRAPPARDACLRICVLTWVVGSWAGRATSVFMCVRVASVCCRVCAHGVCLVSVSLRCVCACMSCAYCRASTCACRVCASVCIAAMPSGDHLSGPPWCELMGGHAFYRTCNCCWPACLHALHAASNASLCLLQILRGV